MARSDYNVSINRQIHRDGILTLSSLIFFFKFIVSYLTPDVLNKRIRVTGFSDDLKYENVRRSESHFFIGNTHCSEQFRIVLRRKSVVMNEKGLFVCRATHACRFVMLFHNWHAMQCNAVKSCHIFELVV